MQILGNNSKFALIDKKKPLFYYILYRIKREVRLMNKKIFITGGTGRIGTCIAQALLDAGGYDVVIGTRGEGDGESVVHVDYSDPQSLIDALKGVHTVIHMGFFMRNSDFIAQHVDNNVKTAYYLYEAARVCGVKRVIFGSSNHVFGFYKKGAHITSDSLYRPDSNYGLAKCFVELIGRYYADRFGVSCINVRIGNFSSDGNTPKDERATYVWLSNDDCAQLFLKLVAYDESCKYLHLFGMSDNDGCFFDTSDNAVVGFEPKDNGAAYRGKTVGKQKGRYYNMPADLLTQHEFVGGYNIVMDQNGEIDKEFLEKLMREQTAKESS